MAGAKRKKHHAGRFESRNINAWAMIRDVLVASISKGQLPIAIIGLILIILCVKIPSEQAGKLLFEILDLLVKGRLLGYSLLVVVVFGWFVHIKLQRRTFTHEISRVSDEKTELQKKLLPTNIESSEE